MEGWIQLGCKRLDQSKKYPPPVASGFSTVGCRTKMFARVKKVSYCTVALFVQLLLLLILPLFFALSLQATKLSFRFSQDRKFKCKIMLHLKLKCREDFIGVFSEYFGIVPSLRLLQVRRRRKFWAIFTQKI